MKMKSPWLLAPLLAALASFPATAAEPPKGENLMLAPPTDYKVVTQTDKDNTRLTEMIPSAESLGDWQDMLSVQIVSGAKGNMTLKDFRRGLEQRMKISCKAQQVAPVASGTEWGYAFEVWMQACSHGNPAQPDESALVKAIKGADGIYLVQKTFRTATTQETAGRWVDYLKEVRLCDSRKAEAACPAGDK